MYIRNASIKIKNIDRDLAGLSPIVVVTGTNGAGKTALLNGITLAVAGKAFDVAGRDSVSIAHAVEELMPADGGRAVLTLDTGTVFAGFKGSGGRLLYDEVSSALVGTEATPRALGWLFFNFLTDEDTAGHSGELASDTASRLLAYVKAAAARGVTSKKARLLAARGDAASAVSALNGEIKVLEATVTTLESIGTDAKVELLSSIEALTKFQFERGLDTCGVCGTDGIARDTFVVRHQNAAAKRGPGGVSVPESLLAHLRWKLEAKRSEQKANTRVVEACNGWVQNALAAKLDAVVAEINKTKLPADYKIGLTLEPRFRFSLSKDGGRTYNTALSGGETVLVLTAIAIAAARRAPSALNFLALPDRYYSPVLIDALVALGAGEPCNIWLTVGAKIDFTLPSDVSVVNLE